MVFSTIPILSVALSGYLAYLISLAIYRIFFHPLAKFPGPKLAALSSWFEIYYDVVNPGQFAFKLCKMHDEYGPIVRITPHELHIRDSNFWDELYTRSASRDKYEFTAGRFDTRSSAFSTVNHEHHRLRRTPLDPLFSRKNIIALQPIIRQKLNLLLDGIAKFAVSGEVLRIDSAWSAFACDVVMQYALGKTLGALESKGFNENLHDAFEAASKSAPAMLHFPWMLDMMKTLPDAVVVKMQPLLARVFQLKSMIRHEIDSIMAGETPRNSQNPTVFHELLESDLPTSEKSIIRLAEEAQIILGAGVETTAWAFSVATYHILSSPKIQTRLMQELTAALPDPAQELEVTHLESLPYLNACVKEGIRLSYGVSGHSARVDARNPLRYANWLIPPKTPISMSSLDVSHDETLFPQSRLYNPERWLDNPKAPNGKPLDHYFVWFGKGNRRCLGMHLALAELHVGIAGVMRRFRLRLFETEIEDAEMFSDFFIPFPRPESKGIRVVVEEDRSREGTKLVK